MSNVIEFKIKKPEPETLGYFCAGCDSTDFELDVDGEIYCSDCGINMTNLHVVEGEQK